MSVDIIKLLANRYSTKVLTVLKLPMMRKLTFLKKHSAWLHQQSTLTLFCDQQCRLPPKAC